MGTTVGMDLVSSMMEAGLEENLSLKLDVTWLKESEQEIFLYVWNHIRKYKKSPALTTVKGHFPDFDLNVTSEPPQFYADKCRERFMFEGLRTGMAKAKNLLDKKLEDFNPDGALQALSQTVSELRFIDQSQDVVDFRKAHELLYADYLKKVSGYYESGVQLGWPTIDEISGGLVGGDVVSILGRPGMGKCLTNDTPVCTPHGWVPMGYLKVGDYVIGSKGTPTKVLGVYPQGQKKAYRVTFRDGANVECSLDHLWTVAPEGGNGRNLWRTHTLGELLERGLTRDKGGNRHGAKWRIPVVEPVQYPEKALPIDPYVLGVLLGDGSLAGESFGFTIGNPDQDILPRVLARLPEDLTVVPQEKEGCYYYALRGPAKLALRAAFREIGLLCKSESKFVPEAWLSGSVAQRLELLRGLMDTDGSCQKNRTVFHTVSEQLADGVVSLVQSLGGIAIKRGYDRQSEGKSYEYQVGVRMNVCPFHSERKKTEWAPVEPARYIWSVEETRVTEQTCILVDASDHLFVAKDYVVTHNTWLLLHSAFKTWMAQKHSPMFVSMEMVPLLIEQRLAALHSQINPTHIKNAELTTVAKKKLFTGLKGLESYDLPFWVVNGNMAATVEDIYNLALQLNPTVIYIDGAYLMQAENRRAAHWEKITDTANGIKQVLSTSLGVPVIGTYQFNRNAAQKMKKKPQEIGLEDIAGADAIGQNSSIVMGLLQEDTVEALTRKMISVLKGRSGESGNFWVNWNFQGGLVGFDEIKDDDEGTMLYLG